MISHFSFLFFLNRGSSIISFMIMPLTKSSFLKNSLPFFFLLIFLTRIFFLLFLFFFCSTSFEILFFSFIFFSLLEVLSLLLFLFLFLLIKFIKREPIIKNKNKRGQ